MEGISQMTLKEVAMMQVNQRLILQGITWEFYQQLLDEFNGSNALHFAYDEGILEVEVPLSKHERPTEILRDLVTNICIEKEIDLINAGKTTFRQRAKSKGVEPDSCFYILNVSQIRVLLNSDLSETPSPDLVIEIDITSPSLDKLPIYAALGVSEVWLYKGDRLKFLRLDGSNYREVKNSAALPMLSNDKANEFLLKGLRDNYIKWIREIRNWANEQ